MNLYHHEELLRGEFAIQRLGQVSMTICGAGAIGSLLVDNLVRQGVRHLKVIDHDRIEEHNVGTQLYGLSDVGGKKADVLKNRVFKATGVEIDAIAKELTMASANKLLRGADVIIDAFDNSLGRRLVQESCRANKTPCLHVGLAADYAEVIWDEAYRVPQDTGLDACNYPLARNVVLLAVTVATESLLGFLLNNTQASYSITLKDLAIAPLEPCGVE
jgi:molybdopterin-synthase adenylyltransferase